jgi:four helix bundle protein
LPGKTTHYEIGKQLMRSGGANYIEADEALSKKDFIMRMKICRKEAKESRYWLALSLPGAKSVDSKSQLMDECTQLIKIFSTIIKNAS